jgi:heterodisulfide reductase subunit B
MKYAYYPGCSLESSAKEYDLSIRACCQYTGVELIEVPDWICCGASSAHATSHLLSIALPAKTLVQTEKMGLHQIIAPCIACLTRLKVADMEMEEKEDLKKDVETVLESSYKGSVRVRNVLDVFLNDVGLDKIEKTVTTPLKGLKVKLGPAPAARATIMVSPMAREMATMKAAANPEKAAGTTT